MIAKEMLKEKGASKDLLELWEKFGDKELISWMPQMDTDSLFWIQDNIFLNDSENTKLNELLHNDKISNFLVHSHHVTNSSVVVDSHKVNASKVIIDSRCINNSMNILHSSDVKDSDDITFGWLLDTCFSCGNLSHSQRCIGCIDCTHLIGCEYLYKSHNCEYSKYCIDVSGYCDNLFLCNNMVACSHCICCYGLSNAEYMIFNQPISKNIFEKIKQSILENFRPEIDNSNKIVYNKLWFDEKAKEFIKAFPFYNAQLMTKITYDVSWE